MNATPPTALSICRALMCKSWSLQIRQAWSNLILVCLCPAAMILACAVIGNVMQQITTKLSGPTKNILFCSQENAVDPSLLYPILDLSDSRLPVSDPSSVPGATHLVTHTNFLQFLDAFAGGGVYSLTSIKPCVYRFGKRYGKGTEDVYALSDGLPQDQRLRSSDSLFQNEPNGGWFGYTTIEYLASQMMLGEMNEILLVGQTDAVKQRLVDESGARTHFKYKDGEFTLSNRLIPELGFSPWNASMGLLDTIEKRIHLDLDPIRQRLTGYREVPSFLQTFEDMDQGLRTALDTVMQNLSTIDTHVLLSPNPSLTDVLVYLLNATSAIQDMPFGGIVFTHADYAVTQYAYTLHMGDNDNLNSVASFPRAELRRLLIQAQLDNAFLRASSPELDSAVITQSLRAFPLLASTDVVLPLGSYVGGILYPFGVSFLLPWFVMNLVKEKEAKILAMLKMNGISVILYSMSQFLTFFTIYLLSAIVFYVSGYVARLQMFVLTSPGVLIILLFVWGMVLVAMSLIASILFQQSSLASAFAFLVVLSSVVASMALDNIYSSMAKYPLALLVLWPPFAFYRALAVINRASYMKNRTPYTILALSGNDEVLRCIFILLAHSLLIPAFYLMAESFPTTDALLSVFLDTTDSKRRSLLLKRLSFNLSFTSREDVDVTQERRRVFECAVDLACDSPLVVQHLKKDYRTGYKTSQAALKGVTFAVEKGVVFGLLGPNGAGKSTLLSILTGSNQATSGMVWVNDMNLDSSRHQIQTCIGVCPQHDIFWGSLTVYEHLLFYARIKGVDKRYEKESVNKLISQVQLDRVAHSATKNLSGGERRRLSIAIAVSGSPKLVFLDEPTTGLDPDVKREIWRIIKDLKAERTIILTTHSMQEADACCNRIAIMSQGKLRCLGTHYRLKEVYGAGFKLKFAVGTLSLAERAQKFVESVLPVNEWSLAHELNSHYVYEFNPVKGSVVQLMKAIEARSKEFGITDWEVSQATLDSVFLKLISMEET